MGRQIDTADRRIARIARSAHGVVTRTQLLEAGISDREIIGRLRKGALIPVHRGVYRVGHRAPSLEARYMAAVRACGNGAVLSGKAAARLLELFKGTPPDPEVTAPGARRVPGIRTGRSRGLDRRDVTSWRGIPVTTPARTMVDLAGRIPLDPLARAFHEAGIKHGTTPHEVEEALGRRANAPGAAALRSVIHGDVPVTLSVLEARFLRLLREAGLPLPETNRYAGEKRVDCRWPALRLTVELDSYRYHSSRYAWEQDRRREREARARDDEFRRYTYGDVVDEPEPMLAELTALLAYGSTRPRLIA
jgi:predicted transcriptional regulator of viral defense system